MTEEPDLHALTTALLDGNCTASNEEARRLLSSGVTVETIVRDGLEAAMNSLDAKCTVEQFNLLEIMLVGRAVMEVMNSLYPPGTTPAGNKGTVVVASLEGDVHDLGKNILKTVLTGKGYRVVDCGKDCPLPKLLDTVEREGPIVAGVSGLITSVVPLVKQIRTGLLAKGLARVKVVAGGAALKQASPAQLNVDYVAESVFDGVRFLDRLTDGGKL